MRTFVIFLPLFVFTLLFAPSLAMAQSKVPLKLTPLDGTILRPAATRIATPEQLWKKIQAANAADLTYAKALADAVGSPGAKLRSACYAALIVTIAQAQSPPFKDASGNALTPPDLHAFSSFEQLAEVAETLQPTGPLMAACAPAWTALRLSAVQFFTLAVSGAAGLSALGVAIP
jgi:hypothetical protein